ncbi:MAG: transporter [Candidatus Methylopumilus sp.]|nr:transporter [Candidatus Methylopumilus sp.]
MSTGCINLICIGIPNRALNEIFNPMIQSLVLFSIAFKRSVTLFLLAALLFISSPSHALDLNPFDVVAPPPDKTIFSTALIHSELEGPYTRGYKSSPTRTLSKNQIQLQLGRTYSLGGYPGISFVQFPVGMLQPGRAASHLPNDYGLGDMTVVTALWPYANRETRTYLGIAGFLTLPTGSYSNQQLYNLGNKRFSGDIQIGYQTALSKNLDGMMGFDAMWFSPNNHVGPNNAQVTQKPLYTSQIGPIYHINPHISVAATYLYVWGAETALNGISNNNALQSHRYLLSAVATTSKGRFMLQYGTNLDTEFGFHETRRVILRYTTVF